MGYGTRNGGIKTFWPDDTDTLMYLESSRGFTMDEIQEKIEEKWPGVSASNIMFDSEYIQTDCLSYDLYDSRDYTDFIKIQRLPGA